MLLIEETQEERVPNGRSRDTDLWEELNADI